MMQLTPQKIAAIKAIADDERGDPNTRKIAQAKLEQYRREQPEFFPGSRIGLDLDGINEAVRAAARARNPPNPRMRKGDDYLKWVFMDLGNWKRSDKGNHVTIVKEDRITLFKNKRGGWSWSRANIDPEIGGVTFKHGFDTIGEAQRDAWASLQI